MPHLSPPSPPSPQVNELFLEEHLKADMSRSCYVGETAAEHRVFVEMVTMGRVSDWGIEPRARTARTTQPTQLIPRSSSALYPLCR